MSLVNPAVHGDIHFEHDVYAVRFRYKFQLVNVDGITNYQLTKNSAHLLVFDSELGGLKDVILPDATTLNVTSLGKAWSVVITTSLQPSGSGLGHEGGLNIKTYTGTNIIYNFSATIPKSVEFYCIGDSTTDGLWTFIGGGGQT